MEKPLKDKLAYWTRHVEKYVDGGLGLAEYCRIHGLKSRQFAYWKRKIMAEKVCFVEVEPRHVSLVDKTSPDVSAGVLIKIGSIEIVTAQKVRVTQLKSRHLDANLIFRFL